MRVLSRIAVLVGIALFVHPVVAQDESAPVTATPPGKTAEGAEASTVIYGRDFIERFSNAVTVVDIIRRIPGGGEFVRRQGGFGNQQAARGFSSNNDRLLINGKRMSGKSNDSVSALERITVDQVERIEMIRGGSPDIKVSSQQAILNIVLREDVATGSGSWRVDGRWRGNLGMGGFLSYGDKIGKLDYFLSAQITPEQRNNPRDDTEFDAGGTLLDQTIAVTHRARTDHDLAANLIYNFDSGSQLRLNGTWSERGYAENVPGTLFLPDPGGTLIESGETIRFESQDDTSWEIGSDFEGQLGDSFKLKILGLVSRSDKFKEQSEDDLVESDPPEVDDLTTEDKVAKEMIGRVSLTWRMPKGDSLEFGTELALNRLDQVTVLFERMGGALVEVPLDTADVTVKETRSESFAILSSKLSARTSLESALFAEYSVLRQITPDGTNSRNFFFLRPSLDFRFNITSADQFQLSARRVIGQLNFSDFVTSVEQDDEKVFEGNADLVQQKIWQFETSFEHRFREDAGFVKIALVYEAFQDRIELIEISPLVSGVGNVGNATKYGVNLKTNIRLTALGLRDAVFEGDFSLSESSVTDPFTGQKRAFNRQSDRSATVRFRHDVTRLGLSYGGEINWSRPGERNDIDQITDPFNRLFSSVFLEVQPFKGVVVRVEGQNLSNNNFGRVRHRFDDGVAGGVLTNTDIRNFFGGRYMEFSIRGTF